MRFPGNGTIDTVRNVLDDPRWSRLPLWQRRAIKTMLAIVGLVVISSLLYHYVLVVYEGRSPGLGHSVQVVIETFTGTGYGSDSPWESPVANAFVAALDLATFLLLFIVVPYVFRPVLESVLSPSPPRSVEKSDHVVVSGTRQQGDRLIDELETRDMEYVIVAADGSRAIDHLEAGRPVIQGDLTSVDTYRRASVDTARAVVVDTSDTTSVGALLAIRELNPSIHVPVLVGSLDRERHLRSVGADRVMTPRNLLGRRIADRIATEISPLRSDRIPIGDDVAILELSVFEDSPICGRSIGAVTADEDSLVVLGIWQDGDFIASPDETTVVDEDTGLLIAGEESVIRELERETYRGLEVAPRVVIAGHGVVGSTVKSNLSHLPAEITVVDLEPGENVDLVGDVTRERTFRELDVEEATVLVVSIADDDDAILSVVLANDLASDLDIIVRLNEDENETKVRRAGADYVLSLQAISGRVLAEEVLHDQIISIGRQWKTVKMDGGPFAGNSLDSIDLPDEDCIIAAVQRDETLITDPAGDFTFRGEDNLIVIGCDEVVDTMIA
ncbi:MAG: potassium channel family protein [Halanaeroarchaeum sp.]